MAGLPAAGAEQDLFARTHGAGLHRTAAILTADAAEADTLLRRTLARGRVRRAMGRSSWSPDVATRHLVRSYLHAAGPHRDERIAARELAGADEDASVVLAGLHPKERAAAVLSHVLGWDPASIADTLGVREHGVASLVPTTRGMRDALESLGDHHGRPADTAATLVREALTSPLDTPASTAPPERPAGGLPLRRAALAALLVAVLGLVGWGMLQGRPDHAAGPPPAAPADLTDRGWVLSSSGSVLEHNEGMQRIERVMIDYARAYDPIELEAGTGGGFARFAVLWCDLPVIDEALDVPVLELTLQGTSVRGSGAQGSGAQDGGAGGSGQDLTVDIPCAGRGGDPPVRALTPLPFTEPGSDGTATVGWSGVLPERGSATLALYAENEGSAAPLSWGRSDGAAPVPGPGSAELSPRTTQDTAAPGEPWVEPWDLQLSYLVEIGPGSTLRAWTGSRMSLGITVDGQVVTGDGDQAADGTPRDPSTAPSQLWQTQDPTLRSGRWVSYHPPQERTFALPQDLLPPAGQKRVVEVVVTTQSQGDLRWQAEVTDAALSSP